MLFNSFSFAVFFPVVTALYFLLPKSLRNLHLLLASCLFYMLFVPVYILILAYTIAVDYASALAIESTDDPRKRKLYLTLSILSTVVVLFWFKYFNFFSENWNAALVSLGVSTQFTLPFFKWVLPIGLSFHTFQSMSYVIEVYRRKQVAERDWLIFSLYVMYYPQLVAGPIERPQNILHQLKAVSSFNYSNTVQGLFLMVWGLFKKVVVADRLAAISDTVFNHPNDYSGLATACGMIAYTFQIYCDFSGYSDIAIGASKCLNIQLMTNFRRPYFSTSLTEFWSRWHISLSTWFRDYLYIPLGGNRVSPSRRLFNVFAVFLVSGLWHGANWTFLVWGALHGLAVTIEGLLKERTVQIPASLRKPMGLLYTFGFATLAWTFFRAANLRAALQMFSQLAHPASGSLGVLLRGQTLDVVIGGLGAVTLIALDYWHRDKETIDEAWTTLGKPWKWAISYALVFAIILLGAFQRQQFIYFQF